MFLTFHLISLALQTRHLQTPFLTQLPPPFEYWLLCEGVKREVVPHSKQGPLQVFIQQNQGHLSPSSLFGTAKQAGVPKAKTTGKNLVCFPLRSLGKTCQP